MATYDPKTIEKKWQAKWEQDRLFECNTSSDRPKYYCLMMFPYPSGDLHVGHGRNYIIGDVVTRYRLMRGYEVLSPMGWDAFGLPAENAAIKRNIHPATWTKSNIEKMKTQLKGWGVGYDWRRELATCDPTYYKWTQWIFLKLYEQGLAYRKLAPVNWCPQCMTVLANDQVVDEKCERCGAEVTKRDLEQWFFRITAYAQRLLDDLQKLPKWSQGVIDRQRARIGRSEGATVDFVVKETGDPLPCYTTRPDTLWGVTFYSVAPENPICKKATGAHAKALAEFSERVKKQTNVDRQKEKEGVFTGLHVVNPVNGDVVPLWAANYVLPEYGTGGVMAVPAHDQRDFEFAKKYRLPIKSVIRPVDGALPDPATMKAAFEDDGIMENSVQFSGKKNRIEGIPAVISWLAESKKGAPKVNFKLHDWCVSRQRYWGAPIPMIHCPKDGTVPVPEKDLPVRLPDVEDFKPKGRSVLEGVASFVDVKCPKCGGPAKRDPDTLDTFVDSAWYYLRYPNATEREKAFDKGIVDKWLPVDQYVGGIEHATGHLLYSRFITKVLKDGGYLSFDEPFQALFTQGMIQMMSYRCPEHVWVAPKDVKWAGDKPTCPTCGKALTPENYKMSKTRGNLVPASEMGETWGVDTQRVYTLAVAPAELDAEWLEEGVKGSNRLIRNVYDQVHALGALLKGLDVDGMDPGALSQPARDLRRKAHETIQKVSADLDGRFSFHTAIARITELKNALPSEAEVGKWTSSHDRKAVVEAIETLVVVFAPFAPHVAEELWHEALGHAGSVFDRAWPTASEHALMVEAIEYAVQVNGKVKAKALFPVEATDEQIVAAALALPDVAKLVAGKPPKMTKVVRGRLVNIVVAG